MPAAVLPIPFSPDDLDPTWLTAALAVRHPGVRVASVDVREVRHVTHTHTFLRLGYDGDTTLPTDLFCKMLPVTERRALLASSRMGSREVQFYNHLQPLLPGMLVPEVVVSVFDPADESFVLLMEDLEQRGCRVPDGTWGIGPDAAAVALEELADLHVRFEAPARRAAIAPWVPNARDGRPVGLVPLRFSLDHHRDKLSPALARATEVYLERADELIARWASGPGPATIVHGDPHLGNLFVDQGRVGWLDWGVINVTTPIRDAGYFIAMAMQVDDRRAHERDLLRHYLDARVAKGGAPITFDDAWLAHRLHALYCVPAACQIMTFPEGATERRTIFASAFLARVEGAINDLDPLGALAELERRG
jgi:hypothetical protein